MRRRDLSDRAVDLYHVGLQLRDIALPIAPGDPGRAQQGQHHTLRSRHVVGGVVGARQTPLCMKAFLVIDGAGDAVLVNEIQDFVRVRLSQHEYPRQIEFVAELPKTPAGKINRKALRDRAAAT